MYALVDGSDALANATSYRVYRGKRGKVVRSVENSSFCLDRAGNGIISDRLVGVSVAWEHGQMLPGFRAGCCLWR